MLSITKSISNLDLLNTNDIHEDLHTNISLLNMVYPPSEELKMVFKKNMFKKNNKAAFQQVIYYLLNIFDPEICKEKLPSWPLFNIREKENKFRFEVLEYIDYINTTHEFANLPKLMPSNIIAPGGFRIVNFIYKLSQFILYVDLNRTYPNEILDIPTVTDNIALAEQICEHLDHAASVINTETNQALKDFQKDFERSSQEAKCIEEEMENLKTELFKIEKCISKEEKQKKCNTKAQEEIVNTIEKVDEFIEKVDKINCLHDSCYKFLSNLNSQEDSDQLNHDDVKIIEAVKKDTSSVETRLKIAHFPNLQELQEKDKLSKIKIKELERLLQQRKNEMDLLKVDMEDSKCKLKFILEKSSGTYSIE